MILVPDHLPIFHAWPVVGPSSAPPTNSCWGAVSGFVPTASAVKAAHCSKQTNRKKEINTRTCQHEDINHRSSRYKQVFSFCTDIYDVNITYLYWVRVWDLKPNIGAICINFIPIFRPLLHSTEGGLEHWVSCCEACKTLISLRKQKISFFKENSRAYSKDYFRLGLELFHTYDV